MKEIRIDTEIGGWGFTAVRLNDELRWVKPGDKVKITIDSPGGDFFEMVAIFNTIRNFARKKENEIETYIVGMAASAASMIALAAKAGNSESKITVEDNSIFMIHNCWTIDVGDHRVFEKQAKELFRIDELQRDIYERQTKKSRGEITRLMDDDSFFYGKEIVESGFADFVIDSGDAPLSDDEFVSAKTAGIANCRSRFAEMKSGMETRVREEKNVSAAMKIAAEILDKMPNVGGVENKEEDKMTLDELKKQNPDLFAQAKDEGVKAERLRVQSHLKMAADSGDVSAALPFIESGAQCSENDVVAKYHEVFTNSLKAKEEAAVAAAAEKLAALRAEDNTPEIPTPAPAAAEDEEFNAFAKELGR